jgi:cardiolipin synthase
LDYTAITTFLEAVQPYIITAVVTVITIIASGHAILYKRDIRAAIGWVFIIWFLPVFGAVLYIVFGINRIRRKARAIREGAPSLTVKTTYEHSVDPQQLAGHFPGEHQLGSLAGLVSRIVEQPLLGGNRITPFYDRETTYAAMIEEIKGAQHSLSLSTYIFGNDESGRMIIDALGEAVGRGVQIRVLIDAAGARYTWPTVIGRLRKASIKVALFLPTFRPSFNMRNHRKLLIADGTTGFTGGMNIRKGYVRDTDEHKGIVDLHFRLQGPVVRQLQEVFVSDWLFSTKEHLDGYQWFPQLDPAGPVFARGIPDGPDEDLDKLLWTVHGALSCARHSVKIITPYFLPDQALLVSLNQAALKGVMIDILLPAKSNIPPIQWASDHILWQLLEHGCRVWKSPPPFDHTKLMVVDDTWVLFGSGNWDTRSFRLNFEFNVECYDKDFGTRMKEHFKSRLSRSARITLRDVDERSLPVKLRDGVSRLMSPYM